MVTGWAFSADLCLVCPSLQLHVDQRRDRRDEDTNLENINTNSAKEAVVVHCKKKNDWKTTTKAHIMTKPTTATRSSTRIKIQAADIKSPRERKPVIQDKKSSSRKKAVKKSPVKGTSVKKTAAVRAGNPLIYDGKPMATLPNSATWPTGWKEKHYERQSGNTATRLDRYWYPPKSDHKLRSIKDVLRYMEAFEKTKDTNQAVQAVRDGKEILPTTTSPKAKAAAKKKITPVKAKATAVPTKTKPKAIVATKKKTTPVKAKATKAKSKTNKKEPTINSCGTIKEMTIEEIRGTPLPV